MDAEQKLEKSRKRITESIAQNIHLYGLPPSAGRQFGMMFFEDRPLTLDDMSAELGMSKTSMSTSIRAMSDAKLVERVWERGVRKDLYKVKDDWYQIFIDMFTVKWRRAVSLHTAAIRKSLSELKELKQEGSLSPELLATISNDIERLEYIRTYYDWLDRLIDAFEDQKIFELVPLDEEDM
ncbi:HTH-type transcriptional repressor OpcR [Sporosarcina sp. NCCP-2716]|uniref:GbsR/MarR family transcriptional regulator n=1 Tax=Sporosarcina sp. NCCP-2716 TaxID=2943679 RepID=UPI00203C4AAF|nr:GbsR/MarR family transcriptional regulator [Sporosarcina sp. NCCP-2716]GKV69229.1 HTH-type transcriptional repressor OpcR [Sporosarcina sp. NCCP-2716]